MRLGGDKKTQTTAAAIAAALWATAASTAAPASASVPGTVLVAPVQGSETLRDSWQTRVSEALHHALEDREWVVISKPLLGRAVVACQTPECIEQTLDAAEAELGIVPAVWAEPSGGQELTLTLLRKGGRNLNASAALDTDADTSTTAEILVDRLLAQHAAARSVSAERLAVADDTRSRRRPHAWQTGPIALLAGGAAAFIAIGVGAATKREDQQVNRAAVATWSALGSAAIAGSIAWWVVGAKRRRAPKLTLRPAGIDLRLRF